MMTTRNNIYPQEFTTTPNLRWELFGHRSPVLWFTGLSGSGKSTIANLFQYEMVKRKIQVHVLDGDNIRFRLNNDLGFTEEDRIENIRRVAEVARLFSNAGVLTICSFISPTKNIRNMAKEIIGKNDFIEVFVDTPIEICERRDPKGLYKKARAGKIKHFTGISAPYEDPDNPDLVIKPAEQTLEQCVSNVMKYLESQGHVHRVPSPDETWYGKNHGNREVVKDKNKHAVFIGRFQPYHKGHISLIRQKLDAGVPVIIMVRDMKPDEKNPFTTEQTVSMIEKYHKQKDDIIKIMVIPDIESVNWGRGVGYEINEFFPPKNIETISATKIRNAIKNSDDSWKELVDECIHKEIITYLGNGEFI